MCIWDVLAPVLCRARLFYLLYPTNPLNEGIKKVFLQRGKGYLTFLSPQLAHVIKTRLKGTLIQFITVLLCLLLLSTNPGFLSFFSFTGWLDGGRQFSQFRFLVEPSDTVVAKNSPDFTGAILHCAASEAGDDYPKPTVRWRRDGQSLKFPDFNDRR